MNSLRNIWHLGIKELRSLWQDKALMVFVLVAFTVMIYTAGSAGSMELHNAPIAVVDEDQTVLSGRIINSLQQPWFLTPDLRGRSEVVCEVYMGLRSQTCSHLAYRTRHPRASASPGCPRASPDL